MSKRTERICSTIERTRDAQRQAADQYADRQRGQRRGAAPTIALSAFTHPITRKLREVLRRAAAQRVHVRPCGVVPSPRGPQAGGEVLKVTDDPPAF